MNKLVDRDEVWAALVRHKGVRAKAADALGVSIRTLNRYIENYNLFNAMEKAGLMHHKGPPRGGIVDQTHREKTIRAAIKRYDGRPDYSELAEELYGKPTPTNVQKVFSALNDLKIKGSIANDGEKWFLLKS